jgi:pyruvate carboxylase
MRVVERAADLADAVTSAAREADAAFGRAEVFIERRVSRAKHIEVQVLGDHHGNLVHLWERDCSVQRRHQKVVEIAPGVNLPPALRQTICDDAVRLCAEVRYASVGTVEFLVDLDRQEHYFLEVNPRIQVEHTVTEMVTGIDLVRSQILVAQGEHLHGPTLRVPPQAEIEPRGVALQCRITTEDPENQFIPDYGRLTTYRSAGGFAVRLDAGNAFAGSVITPYFDSLLVKLTTWGNTLDEAIQRTDRALREFRVRGVKTNIVFLENLVRHPTFKTGEATTDFIDSAPELFRVRQPRDRATKILTYLADVIVNGRADVKRRLDPTRVLPAPVPPDHPDGPPPDGLRQRLQRMGPEAFAAWVRRRRPLLITDTTMRDAHQSLMATRVRTHDLAAVAQAVAHTTPNLFSLEMWGGATFDTSMRFLQEDPWLRLRVLRERIPNILFQMLLRGSNAVGYTSYPDSLVRAFVRESAAAGIDVFRIFDALNGPANMKVAMETVRTKTDRVCEAAICYTGDIQDPSRTKYSLRYYVDLAKKLVDMGAHMIAIKDMAGLCKPYAAHALVKALRAEIGVPIHFHTHDTAGTGVSSALRAADAGVDIVDAAFAAMSGMTSQPSLNTLTAALRHTRRDTGLDQDALDRIDRYWAQVRDVYYPFDAGLRAPAPDVYRHEMPGGQYTNLRQRATTMGLGDRWPEVCSAYAAANALFGDIVKVTPSSKVVGDLAMYMVSNQLGADDILDPTRPLSFPASVVEMMRGMLGHPPGGWPTPIRKAVLEAGRATPVRGRPGAHLPPLDLAAAEAALAAKIKRHPTHREVLSALLYPDVFREFAAHTRRYGDTSVIPTRNFFYGLTPGEEIAVEIETGKTLVLRYLTVGEPREDGTRTVFFELNGQPREVRVVDHAVEATQPVHPKAAPGDPNQVGAPMPGKVGTLVAEPGLRVSAGSPLLWIEAMKMETSVSCPRDGTIDSILVEPGTVVDAGDLLLTLKA